MCIWFLHSLIAPFSFPGDGVSETFMVCHGFPTMSWPHVFSYHHSAIVILHFFYTLLLYGVKLVDMLLFADSNHWGACFWMTVTDVWKMYNPLCHCSVYSRKKKSKKEHLLSFHLLWTPVVSCRWWVCLISHHLFRVLKIIIETSLFYGLRQQDLFSLYTIVLANSSSIRKGGLTVVCGCF